MNISYQLLAISYQLLVARCQAGRRDAVASLFVDSC